MVSEEVAKKSRKLMLVGIILFLCAWYLGTAEYKSSFKAFIYDLIEMASIAVLQWMVIIWVIKYFRKKYMQETDLLVRVLLTLFSSGLIGMCIAFLILQLPLIIFNKQRFNILLILEQFGPMFFFSALVVGAYEVLYGFYEMKRINREREELKKAQLQSQFDSLKAQVNPHFLFNSLNTLLTLITTSPPKAEKFVLELSSVYRYLLKTNENEMTTLQQEIQFLNSYFHLLKNRFADAIQLIQLIDDEYLYYHLPSLTLQLLIENAVKHNIISIARPLTITLRTFHENENVYLEIKNNLQRKKLDVFSSRMGLNNIISKFKLLNVEEIEIIEKDNYFIVILPLLKNSGYEPVNS